MANFKINIQSKNYDLTNDIRNLINEKVSYFEKFMPLSEDDEVLVEAEVEKTTRHHNQGPVYRAEFNVKYKSEFKRAEATEENVRTAIETASDELAKQIRRSKGKKISRVRAGAAKVKSWLRFGR